MANHGDGGRPSCVGARVAARTMLESQILHADHLLVLLAAIADRGSHCPDERAQLGDLEQSAMADASEAVWRLTRRWLDTIGGDLAVSAHWAAADALLGIDLRPRIPDLSEVLERSWACAMAARDQLAGLGREAEQLALRLAPSWRSDLEDLTAATNQILNLSGPPARL